MASSFDCKPIYNYTALLKSFAEQSDQTDKLEEFLSLLEEERLKIDAFKRELPLCMQLLTNAVETSKQQLQTYRRSTNIEEGPKPVLEEFIPLKNSNFEGSEKITTNIYDNKANWMTSAQLWSQVGEELNEQQTTITTSNTNETADIISLNVSSKLGLDNKQRNGGAFIPFSKDRNLRSLPELALASVDENSEDKRRCFENDNRFSCQRTSEYPNKNDQQGKENGNDGLDQEQIINNSTNSTNGSGTTQSNNRKARRCWSPDLHRRFVNALQMLGGSQVATPKQIRELMKVDGLTNDEVKSHLQKYRLHTRRPSPNPQVAGGPAPQLVVLGGIWVPPEYATAHTSAPTALYGPPHPGIASHAPTHYCVPPVPQDFYSAPPPPPHQLHHHQLHHVYKTTSHTHSSPESDFRGIVGGDRSESIEDGKSESNSWKGESGEHRGGRKGLASFREDGGESINESEITLKF